MITAALVVGAGIAAGVAAVWPLRWPAAWRRTRPPVELPHRPEPGAAPSPLRHRVIHSHTGSIPAAAILAALKAGRTTDEVLAELARRQDRGT